ncbi:lymphocyte cytosolic protein 2-like isoform X2 [Varroa destructor]|uniref:SH2 domain-containing protein n=1 Tax=Varroa destructor TaxID=109461 RepID=A0A7M7KY58_VARDE|nr:lymphocyte cytosolic protein 2-like isoform X2 [Varroa destructor]
MFSIRRHDCTRETFSLRPHEVVVYLSNMSVYAVRRINKKSLCCLHRGLEHICDATQIAKAVSECKTRAENAKQLVGDLKTKRLSVGHDVRVGAGLGGATGVTGEGDDDGDLSVSDIDGDTDFDESYDEDDRESVSFRVDMPPEVMPDKAASPDYVCHNSSSEPKDDASSLGSEASSYASASSNGLQVVGGSQGKRPPLPRPAIPTKPYALRQRRRSAARPTSPPPPPPIPTQPPPAPPSESSVDYEVPLCHEAADSETSSSLVHDEQSTYEQIEHREEMYEVVHEGNGYTINNSILSVAAAIRRWEGSKSKLKSSSDSANNDSLTKYDRNLTYQSNLTDSASPREGRPRTSMPSGMSHLTPWQEGLHLPAAPKPPLLPRQNCSVLGSLPAPPRPKAHKPLKGASNCCSTSTGIPSSPSTPSLHRATPAPFVSEKNYDSVSLSSLINRPLPPVPTGENVYADVDFEPNEKLLHGLSVYPWFHDVEREDVDRILKEVGEQGCFLVRISRRGGPSNPFTLSLLHEGRIFHLNIRKRPDGMFALGSAKPREKTFNTVSELIDYHRQEEILLTSRNQPAGSTRLTETSHSDSQKNVQNGW